MTDPRQMIQLLAACLQPERDYEPTHELPAGFARAAIVARGERPARYEFLSVALTDGVRGGSELVLSS